MAQKCAWARGARRVIGLDPQSYRLDMARKAANSETINIEEGDCVEKIHSMTEGRGADVCIDAVGMEADRTVLDKLSNIVHAQAGSIKALKLALSAVRRGGIVSVVGVYGIPYDNFPLGQIFDKGLTLRFGQAPAQKYIDELIQWVEGGKISWMILSPIASPFRKPRMPAKSLATKRTIA
ncbi:MAG: alanine acetyltransferase [Verrucomicrobiales bacterium]|jgi:S-(hydroxymethyl)glutathione dehydrogenase/alcohol dehydrogenase|nr:alanine acetyltransferase [Verrucomicrobiales bacterium]